MPSAPRQRFRCVPDHRHPPPLLSRWAGGMRPLTTRRADVSESSTTSPTLADKINKLFGQVRKPNGKPYSSAEVADWCQKRTGESFSRAYMSYLRKGQRTNPTQQHLAALAAFFDVSPAYFFDDQRSTHITAQ